MNKLILQSLLLSIIFTSSSMENNQNPDNRDPLINNQLTDQRLEVSSNVQLNNISELWTKWCEKVNKFNEEINKWNEENKSDEINKKFDEEINKFNTDTDIYNEIVEEWQKNVKEAKAEIEEWQKKIEILENQLHPTQTSDTKKIAEQNKKNRKTTPISDFSYKKKNWRTK